MNEYLQKGDYHRNLDKNWRFYPVYVAKMRLIDNFLAKVTPDKKIIDVGCGEGVLVKKYREKNYDIIGVDLNYQAEYIFKKEITNTGFVDNSFDIAFCLDVIEHLSFDEQEIALAEIRRILKPDGILVLTIPNLAHLASRFSFLLIGKLLRTSKITRHKGDRPIGEYLYLLTKAGFLVQERRGLFPTFPVSSLLTYFFPSKMTGWHKILNAFFAYPNWCFLNFLICRKNDRKN